MSYSLATRNITWQLQPDLNPDSIDIPEYGQTLKNTYHIHIDTHTTALVNYLASLKSLVGFVDAKQK